VKKLTSDKEDIAQVVKYYGRVVQRDKNDVLLIRVVLLSCYHCEAALIQPVL